MKKKYQPPRTFNHITLGSGIRQATSFGSLERSHKALVQHKSFNLKQAVTRYLVHFEKEGHLTWKKERPIKIQPTEQVNRLIVQESINY